MLVTHHSDLTVRFRDLSAQLLHSSDTNPLQTSYPNPLPSLTIDVLALLADPTAASHTPPNLLAEAHIVSSHLAPQSLECAVVLKSGEVAVFRLNNPPSGDVMVPKTLDDPELISATHVSIVHGRYFYPAFILATARGSVSALAISDIGEIILGTASQVPCLPECRISGGCIPRWFCICGGHAWAASHPS